MAGSLLIQEGVRVAPEGTKVKFTWKPKAWTATVHSASYAGGVDPCLAHHPVSQVPSDSGIGVPPTGEVGTVQAT